MAKVGKNEMARIEGARWAFEKIAEKGLEEAKKEFEYRGTFNIPYTELDEKEIHRYEQDVKTICMRTICAMSLMVLADEFDFTREQLIQFKKRFNKKTEVLEDHYATWADYREILMDEYDIDVDKIEEEDD